MVYVLARLFLRASVQFALTAFLISIYFLFQTIPHDVLPYRLYLARLQELILS